MGPFQRGGKKKTKKPQPFLMCFSEWGVLRNMSILSGFPVCFLKWLWCFSVGNMLCMYAPPACHQPSAACHSLCDCPRTGSDAVTSQQYCLPVLLSVSVCLTRGWFLIQNFMHLTFRIFRNKCFWDRLASPHWIWSIIFVIQLEVFPNLCCLILCLSCLQGGFISN